MDVMALKLKNKPMPHGKNLPTRFMALSQDKD
jgi:hypothetical protein